MKKILFLAANPKGTSPLRLDQEAREIETELRRSHQDSSFLMEQRWAVRPRDIQQAMLDIGPHIVHFSGHGMGVKFTPPDPGTPRYPDTFRSTATLKRDVGADFEPIGPQPGSPQSAEVPQESGLIFEDDRGHAKLVSGEALAGLFELFADGLECVFLNGCYSASQALVIAEYVPYVIGMRQEISDKAAIEFAVGFYKAVGAGRSVEFAYKLGRNAIQMAGIPEHLTPTLISKSDLSAHVAGIPASQPPSPPTAPPEFPSGLVGLESRFYIERFPNETRRYQSITQPGCLLRIMAPDLMGKTSLMERVLHYARQEGYRSAYLNLRDAERRVLKDLNSFLYWFSERLLAELALDNKLDQIWDEASLGCITNCTDAFEKQVLSQIEQPIVLGIDELDRIFPYPDIATDFFGMLRNWFERGKNHPLWKQLRLVLAYSTEDYSQFRINQSPFNIGEPLKLRELTQQQVRDLANRYGLSWTDHAINQLMDMVGGHPFLLRLAMYYVSIQETDLEQLLQEAPTEDGIYSDHLHRHWKRLQSYPELIETVSQIMNANGPVSIERSHSYHLRSMGLIQYADHGKLALPSCNLYRIYFSK